MSGFLDRMATGSRERADAAIAAESLPALRARCRDLAPPPGLARRGGFDLIAELKLRSPALGELGRAGEDLAGRVTTYATAGAAAVSVLTEPSRFGGSLAHLREAAAALAPLGVPAMRKDFLVDPYQLYEARAAGAGGALLIVRMLSRPLLGEMLDCARELGLFVLVEAFDDEDIAVAVQAVSQARLPTSGGPLLAPKAESRVAGTHRSSSPRRNGSGTTSGTAFGRPVPPVRSAPLRSASQTRSLGDRPSLDRARTGNGATRSGQPEDDRGPPGSDFLPFGATGGTPGVERAARGDVLIGVNSRDLQTLEVVPERLEQLAARLPRELPRVAESGLTTPEDAARMVRAGYDMALVGGALMSAADPGALVRAMLAAGRAAAT